MLTRIRKLGDPVLLGKTHSVTNFKEGTQDLAADMTIVMHEHNGIGLAANQVGLMVSMFVYDDQNGHYGAICNPHLEFPDEAKEIYVQEGCLSVPGEFHSTPRYDKVILRGTSPKGNACTIHAQGFLAQIFQHETDHLNGKLYITKLPKATQMAIVLANQVI